MSVSTQCGDYEIITKLGGGGQGRVFKAKCNVNNHPRLAQDAIICIKELGQVSQDDDTSEKHQERTKTLITLEHPNIVDYIDMFVWSPDEWDEWLYIVLEYLEGETLTERLERYPRGLPLEEVRHIFNDVISALIYARDHGLIHRDLKPSNIFLTRDGKVKIIDFDLARQESAAQKGMTSGGIRGSFDFMAPDFAPDYSPSEAFNGDEMSDIFSLGVCIYNALTGRLPYGLGEIKTAIAYTQHWRMGRTDIKLKIPKSFRGVISHTHRFFERALAIERDRRFRTFDDMLEMLHKLRRRIVRRKGGDEYELIEFISEGGFGKVYKGRRRRDSAPVAIKQLKAAAASTRFIKEAKVLQKFAHPQIVQFIDFFEVPGRDEFFLILEYLDGMPGWSLSRRVKKAPEGLEPKEVAILFTNYLKALDYLHQHQIIHRDIKPANLYAPPNHPESGKLFDLGVARDVEGTKTYGMVPGTMDYMAPEFADSSRERGSPQSDIFAMGLCMYESLVGVPVYPRLSTSEREAAREFVERCLKDVPFKFNFKVFREFPGLKKILRKATARKPEQRYASSALMTADLQKVFGRRLLDTQSDETILLDETEMATAELPTPQRQRIIADVLASRAAVLPGSEDATQAVPLQQAVDNDPEILRELREGAAMPRPSSDGTPLPHSSRGAPLPRPSSMAAPLPRQEPVEHFVFFKTHWKHILISTAASLLLALSIGAFLFFRSGYYARTKMQSGMHNVAHPSCDLPYINRLITWLEYGNEWKNKDLDHRVTWLNWVNDLEGKSLGVLTCFSNDFRRASKAERHKLFLNLRRAYTNEILAASWRHDRYDTVYTYMNNEVSRMEFMDQVANWRQSFPKDLESKDQRLLANQLMQNKYHDMIYGSWDGIEKEEQAATIESNRTLLVELAIKYINRHRVQGEQLIKQRIKPKPEIDNLKLLSKEAPALAINDADIKQALDRAIQTLEGIESATVAISIRTPEPLPDNQTLERQYRLARVVDAPWKTLRNNMTVDWGDYEVQFLRTDYQPIVKKVSVPPQNYYDIYDPALNEWKPGESLLSLYEAERLFNLNKLEDANDLLAKTGDDALQFEPHQARFVKLRSFLREKFKDLEDTREKIAQYDVWASNLDSLTNALNGLASLEIPSAWKHKLEPLRDEAVRKCVETVSAQLTENTDVSARYEHLSKLQPLFAQKQYSKVLGTKLMAVFQHEWGHFALRIENAFDETVAVRSSAFEAQLTPGQSTNLMIALKSASTDALAMTVSGNEEYKPYTQEITIQPGGGKAIFITGFDTKPVQLLAGDLADMKPPVQVRFRNMSENAWAPLAARQEVKPGKYEFEFTRPDYEAQKLSNTLRFKNSPYTVAFPEDKPWQPSPQLAYLQQADELRAQGDWKALETHLNQKIAALTYEPHQQRLDMIRELVREREEKLKQARSQLSLAARHAQRLPTLDDALGNLAETREDCLQHFRNELEQEWYSAVKSCAMTMTNNLSQEPLTNRAARLLTIGQIMNKPEAKKVLGKDGWAYIWEKTSGELDTFVLRILNQADKPIAVSGPFAALSLEPGKQNQWTMPYKADHQFTVKVEGDEGDKPFEEQVAMTRGGCKIIPVIGFSQEPVRLMLAKKKMDPPPISVFYRTDEIKEWQPLTETVEIKPGKLTVRYQRPDYKPIEMPETNVRPGSGDITIDFPDANAWKKGVPLLILDQIRAAAEEKNYKKMQMLYGKKATFEYEAHEREYRSILSQCREQVLSLVIAEIHAAEKILQNRMSYFYQVEDPTLSPPMLRTETSKPTIKFGFSEVPDIFKTEFKAEMQRRQRLLDWKDNVASLTPAKVASRVPPSEKLRMEAHQEFVDIIEAFPHGAFPDTVLKKMDQYVVTGSLNEYDYRLALQAHYMCLHQALGLLIELRKVKANLRRNHNLANYSKSLRKNRKWLDAILAKADAEDIEKVITFFAAKPEGPWIIHYLAQFAPGSAPFQKRAVEWVRANERLTARAKKLLDTYKLTDVVWLYEDNP